MSLDFYTGLLADTPRIEAFRDAIGEVVKPGDRVLEVGAGLGTYAFFAAQAGADKVWAVEPGPIVHLASSLARANDLHDRVECLRASVPDVQLPERADVVIFEDFPTRLVDQRAHGLLRSFRDRYLKPEGCIVPAIGRLCIAPASGSGLSRGLDAERPEAFGIDWSVMFPYLANGPRYVKMGEDVLLARPSVGPELRLLDPPGPAELAVEGEWRFEEAGDVEALLQWFEIRVGARRWLSNAPGTKTVWGQIALPLVPAIHVPAGGQLTARVAPDTRKDGAPGWLSWQAESGSTRVTGHEFAAEPGGFDDLFTRRSEEQ